MWPSGNHLEIPLDLLQDVDEESPTFHLRADTLKLYLFISSMCVMGLHAWVLEIKLGFKSVNQVILPLSQFWSGDALRGFPSKSRSLLGSYCLAIRLLSKDVFDMCLKKVPSILLPKFSYINVHFPEGGKESILFL